ADWRAVATAAGHRRGGRHAGDPAGDEPAAGAVQLLRRAPATGGGQRPGPLTRERPEEQALVCLLLGANGDSRRHRERGSWPGPGALRADAHLADDFYTRAAGVVDLDLLPLVVDDAIDDVRIPTERILTHPAGGHQPVLGRAGGRHAGTMLTAI